MIGRQDRWQEDLFVAGTSFDQWFAYDDAQNRLAKQIPRDWAISTQEFTGYSSPVPDGNRMYIRGERTLYCIGAQ